MTINECYIALGGNYDDVLGRLRSERLIQKFVLKFLDDKSFETLCSSMQEENLEEAFRAAHTIKGTCLNLGFTKLGNSSSEITEALRSGDMSGAKDLMEQVRRDYQQTVDAIHAFQAGIS